MSIAVDILAAVAGSLLRMGDIRDTAQNQDADYQGCGFGCGGKSVHLR